MTQKVSVSMLADTGTLPAWDGTALTGVAVDVSNIENDLSTLALRQASNENKAAYNTNSMYIDVFQDSTGITGLTDTERNASEYMRSFGSTSVPYNAGTDFASASTYGMIQLSAEGSPVSGGHSGSFAGDSIMTENVSTHNGAVVARAFSCAGDWESRIYGLNSSGGRHATSFAGWGALMIPDDTYARTNASSDIFKVPGAGTVNAIHPSPNVNAWATLLMNTTYATAQGVASYALYSNTESGSGNTQRTDNCGGNGFVSSGYRNATANSDNQGIYAKYQVSTGTLTVGILSTTANSTSIHLGASVVTSGIPTNGTILFSGGDANGGSNQTAGLTKYSLTYSGMNNTSTSVATFDTYPSGSVITEAVTATGSFTSNTITAPSSITSMGAIITYQDNAGTNALNTDIIMKLSADDGVTYSTATLVAMPNFSTGIKMAKVNDLAVTAGTSLKYKIEFANQVDGAKTVHIRGVSLQY
jgi:hypothetical protein